MQNSVSQIEVHFLDGSHAITLDLQQSSAVTEQVGGDCYVKIVSNNTTYVRLEFRSYIVYNGQMWFVRDNYEPQFEDGFWSYDVNFYRPQCCLSNFILARPVSVTDAQGVTTTWTEPNFAINANKKTICELVISAIDTCIVGREQTYFSREFERLALPTGHDYQDTKLVSFSWAGASIKQALDDIADAYECDWWIDGGVLFMEKHETNRIIELADIFGESGGMKGNVSNGVASIKFASQLHQKPTKLYFYGGTRNILPKQANENGLDISYDTRLRLAENHYYTITLADGTTTQLYTDDRGGVGSPDGREEVIIDEDIYPSVHFAIRSVIATNQANGKPLYHCKAQAVGLSQAALNAQILIAQGKTATIVFDSGNLNGMEFEVRFKTNVEHYGDFDFIIVPIESDYTLIPNPVLIPKYLDTFVLCGVELNVYYISQAQQILAEKAYQTLKEYEEFVPAVNVVCEPAYIEANGVTVGLGDVVHVETFRVQERIQNRVEFLKYPICSPNELEFRLSESKPMSILKSRDLDLANIKRYFDHLVSAAMGENEFITIYNGGQIATLSETVGNVAGLVPTGVATKSNYALSSDVAVQGGRVSLTRGVLRSAGGSVNIPEYDFSIDDLDRGTTYGIIAVWDDGDDDATVDVVDSSVVPLSDFHQEILATLRFEDDVWTIRYTSVKGLRIDSDGIMRSSDVSNEVAQEITKGKAIGGIFGATYVDRELLLSPSAAKKLADVLREWL